MKFGFEIQETYMYKGEVEADSKEEAALKVKELYNDDEQLFSADACSYNGSSIKIIDHIYVLAKNDGVENYFNGKKYTVGGETYGGTTCDVECAKKYKSKKTAQRALDSLIDNCTFGYEFYIKEI